MAIHRKPSAATLGRCLCTLALASAVLPGCAMLPAKLQPKPRMGKRGKGAVQYVPTPLPVGKVTLVNVEGKYALVDNENFPAPPTGGVLRSFSGNEQTAEMVASDVRRRPFVIADIKSGEPHKGERVQYIPPELLKKAEGAKPGDSAKPEEATKPAPQLPQ